MKYTFALILFLFNISLVVAQPRFSSNKGNQNFGQVEWKNPKTVNYIITNTGNKPLVINNVTTSCGCTEVQWTKTPIAPKSQGTIAVTFDAKQLGHFKKTISIYSNAEPHMVYLAFSGEVVTSIVDYTKTNPYAFGDVYTDKKVLDFGKIVAGQQKDLTMTIVNKSDRVYEPDLMHLPSYVKMKIKPSVLMKGEKGEIQLTLDTKGIKETGWVQVPVYLARFSGDKVNESNLLPISVLVEPDFSKLSEIQKKLAPTISLDKNKIDMSHRLSLLKKISSEVKIMNTGKSPLQIEKVQVFQQAVGVSLSSNLIKEGKFVNLKITINKALSSEKDGPYRIVLVSNDPKNPIEEITVLH